MFLCRIWTASAAVTVPVIMNWPRATGNWRSCPCRPMRFERKWPLRKVASLLEVFAPAMFSDQIEKMKREYTDKYVVVDATRPELARFRDVVGRVKTVNMSGRALVEFDDYHLNIGWYDIDPDFLKVVDKPPPKAPKAEVKKPAAKAEAKPVAAKASPATGAKAAGKGSVADILAAARAGKAPVKPAGETVKADKTQP